MEKHLKNMCFSPKFLDTNLISVYFGHLHVLVQQKLSMNNTVADVFVAIRLEAFNPTPNIGGTIFNE